MMNTLQQNIIEEINSLPLVSQKEVLDFARFLKSQLNKQKSEPHYSLDELLAQCDETAELSAEDAEWLNAKPMGEELSC
jgi:hypothetical protein